MKTLRITAGLAALCVSGALLASASAAPAGKAASTPRFPLLGSVPTDGGKLVGNSVVMLFGDLPAEVGTPEALAQDETTKAATPTRTNLDCRSEERGSRRCVLMVILPKVEVGHRYVVKALGHAVRFTAAPGHPGDRPRR